MHLVYIDESKDYEINSSYIYSALCINESVWRDVYQRTKNYRINLRDTYGIYIKKELHANKFVGGKGQIANRPILKPERAQIFRETIQFISRLDVSPENVTLFNSMNSNEHYAFERLVNRINRTMQAWDSRAMLIFDEGQEGAFTKRIRKMGVINHIPSAYGLWADTGQPTRNIVIDRIIEDPVFKDSEQSYFIQLVDFCAYSLLRKEFPLPSKTALGIHQTFDILEPICFKNAARTDPMGVIR